MSNKEFNKRFEEILKDLDGLFTSILYVFDPNNPESDFKKSNENPHQKVVNALQKELDECIKEQDFERAAILRDEIKNLTKNKSKIVELQKELEKVIQEQNFERAIEIRDELKKIN